MQVRVQEDESQIGNCGCGRSPTGKCIGWHGLSEDDYQAAKNAWDLAEYAKQAQALWSDSCTTPRSASPMQEQEHTRGVAGFKGINVPPPGKMSYGEFCVKFPFDDTDLSLTVDDISHLSESHGIDEYHARLELFRRAEYDRYLNGDPYYNEQST